MIFVPSFRSARNCGLLGRPATFGRLRCSMRFGSIGLLSALIACSPPERAPAPPPRPPPKAGSTRAPLAADSPLFAYETVRLAEGVYAFVVKDPGDSMLVAGDDGALFVDTGHFPSLARRMILMTSGASRSSRCVMGRRWHCPWGR